MKLNELPFNIYAEIISEPRSPHLRELGITKGQRVMRTVSAPAGGSSAYLIRGAVIALRDGDAGEITAEPLFGEAPVTIKNLRRAGEVR